MKPVIAMPTKQTTFWVIEDNTDLRETIAGVVGRQPHLRCTGDFASCEEAFEALGPGRAPHIFLLDVRLPGINGIAGIPRLKELAPEAGIIILTVFGDDDKIFRALCAGASGYLLKTSTSQEIEQAILEVRRGGAPMSPQIARRVLGMFSRFAPPQPATNLTGREREILELLVGGLGNKEIGARLNVSIHTVDFHMRHIYEKLHVHSRAGAVAKAVKDRLV